MAETKEATKKKASTAKYSKEQYLEWYELMLRIRRFEERALREYGQNNIRGFCHVYIGQEAIAGGIASAKKEGDVLVTAYRQHGIALALGIDTNEAMAELWGKKTGINKGKGGSMHFFSKEHNYFGGNGIVGAQIPIGTGMGLAEQYRGTDNLSITMFGDGASRQGALYESFNMAMTWKLPVLYIAENNGYAMGTSVGRTSNVTDLYKLGRSFDMPASEANGMDVEETHEALVKAMEHIRSGKGPYLLELKTYRYKGHSISDPASYRTKEEVNKYKDIDPVKMLEKKILDNDIASKEEIKEIKDSVKAAIEESIKFSQESDYPDPSALYDDNYVQEDYPFMRD